MNICRVDYFSVKDDKLSKKRVNFGFKNCVSGQPCDIFVPENYFCFYDFAATYQSIMSVN